MARGRVHAGLVAMLALLAAVTQATELTFDMEPHHTACFYAEVKDDEITVEYQVVYGGRLDIDVEVKGPGDREIWRQQRSQTGTHTFDPPTPGEYSFCFSNQFSTVAHKTVYIDIEVGDEAEIQDEIATHHTALTQMETMLVEIHGSLKKVENFQTHHRLREATHRLTAEYMNERVQMVSAAEALLLVLVSVFQIMYLRSLFSDKPNRF